MQFYNGMGRNQALNNEGPGLVGSSICICPKCGYQQKHQRGVPCNQVSCPKCGTEMKGENC